MIYADENCLSACLDGSGASKARMDTNTVRAILPATIAVMVPINGLNPKSPSPIGDCYGIQKKRHIFTCHAGLDPASSNATSQKESGFRVRPGMT